MQLRVARCAGSCAASTAGHSQISNFIPQHNTTHTHLFFLSRYITTFLDASGSSPHHKPPSFHTFVSFALFTIPPYHSRHHLIFLHLACYLLAHNQVMRSKLRMARLCIWTPSTLSLHLSDTGTLVLGSPASKIPKSHWWPQFPAGPPPTAEKTHFSVESTHQTPKFWHFGQFWKIEKKSTFDFTTLLVESLLDNPLVESLLYNPPL